MNRAGWPLRIQNGCRFCVHNKSVNDADFMLESSKKIGFFDGQKGDTQLPLKMSFTSDCCLLIDNDNNICFAEAPLRVSKWLGLVLLNS